MFKIGEFSRISRVPVKTLRYYDEIGLLVPAQVDQFTSYRYYTFEQLPRLNRILALKDLGFSLEQIARMVDDKLTADELRGMLKLRMGELQQQVEETQARLDRAAARLYLIEREGKMTDYEVILKQVEPLTIISVREIVPSSSQMRERCIALNDEVCAVLAQGKVKATELSLALYHAGGEEDIDVEMAFVVAESGGFNEAGRVKLYTLPAVQTMASAVYHGSYDDFGAVGKVYADINQWIAVNGYRITGPSRELYLRAPELCKDDPSGIMEIQFPVEKK